MDRYRLKGIFILSMEIKKYSVIWVQRAYHEEFGYEKMPSAAQMKR